MAIMGKRGVSPIISMVLITAILLVILMIASFLATSLLEIQMQNSEFEQAKTTMLLLDKIIMDVSLRPGAASSVQFNQRSGGIGMYESEPINIKIIDVSRSEVIGQLSRPIRSYVIKYRGGSMVSAAETNLTNPGGLIIDMSTSKPLGHVRVEVKNGVWVTLDYNRIYVALSRNPVNPNLMIMDIYLICLKQGRFGGSGTITVRVQNTNIEVERLGNINNPINSLAVQVEIGGLSETRSYQGTPISDVRVTIVNITVSIT